MTHGQASSGDNLVIFLIIKKSETKPLIFLGVLGLEKCELSEALCDNSDYQNKSDTKAFNLFLVCLKKIASCWSGLRLCVSD